MKKYLQMDFFPSIKRRTDTTPLEKMSEFHPRMQVSLLDYIRYASSNWKDEMLSMLETSQDMEIQIACVRYFGRYQDEKKCSFLLHHAEEEKEGFWELQNACISALAVYPGPQTLEILKKATSSKNWYVRYNAAKSLAVLNTDRDALADILQGNDRYAKEMLEYQLDAVKAQRGRAYDRCISFFWNVSICFYYIPDWIFQLLFCRL